MKKLNVILNETTVIDFGFVWELCKRYSLITMLTPVLLFAVGVNFYYGQHDIYMQSVSFKALDNEAESTNSAVASLLGESTKRLTPSEIIGIVKQRDFIQKLSKRIFNHPKFKEINFNGIRSKKMRSHSDFFGACEGHVDCIVKKIENLVPGFYKVNQDKFINTQFHLTVKTLDKETSKILLEEVSEEMIKNRVSQIKHTLTEQEKIARDLIAAKKKEIDNLNPALIQESQSNQLRDLTDLQKQIDQLRVVYRSEEMKYEYLKQRHEKSLKAVKSRKKGGGIESKAVRAKKLKERIGNLREDISALRLSVDDFGAEDKTILIQLEKELKEKEEELLSMGDLSQFSTNESEFIEKQDKASRYYQFDYEVVKGQFSKIKRELNMLIAKRDLKEEKYRKLKIKVDEIKPHFEYLRLLEEKLSHTRLMRATIVPDLLFDKNLSPLSRYKMVSLGKTLLFSFALSFLMTFLLLVGRYLLDNRIYNEYELQKNFENLSIIGITPEFKDQSST